MRTNTSLQSRKKERILELRSQNYTYREIQEAIPGLSRGTISYHCGEGQKEKSYKRMMKLRDKGIRYEPNRWQYIEKVERLKEVA